VRALGERAARGDRPHLPTWLAPTQVRCIPIESRHLDSCERLAEQLAAEAVRVDIDDRERPVGERIEAADRAWVPYTVVVGDDEGDSERLGVFDRNASRERQLTVAELATRVRDEAETETQQRQSLPRRLSAYSVLV
jgi:threonyl-tRNA synthetase